MPSQDPNPSQSGSTQHPLDRYTVQPQQNGGSEGQQQSPYYKSQAPSISLPKGGGALKGIDEKFNVNAVNGTAGLDIPFPLSPGRGGFTPALSLSYNSGSGNSEFGMGWSMSLPSIQRRTDKRLPQYDDETHSDIFLLAGAEDLVPSLDESGEPVDYTDGDYRIRAYRPRIEGLFARIELIGAKTGGDCWWRVATKDNILTYYGLSASARIADPEAPGRIFRWLPELVVDHKGNAQRYYYVAEDKVNIIYGAHEANRAEGTFANTYLKSVGYCNLLPIFITGDVYAPALPGTGWLMEAVLDYGDHDAEAPAYAPSQDWQGRIDAFSDFHAGFEIRTYRRCRRILMFHRFRELNAGSSLDPVLVRSLDLAYYQDQEPNDPAQPNDHAGIDYIVSITQTGYYTDGSSNLIKKSLPPVSLGYQPIVWDHTIHSVSRDDAANAPQGLSGNYQWTDFFGEGLPGILSEQGNAWWYKRNLGDGHFEPALNMAPKPSLAGLGSSLQWQDLDADGRRQVVTYDSSLPGYFEATLPDAGDVDGIQEWEAFRAFRENSNIDWNSPFNKMLDLDGDGRPDLLLCEDRVFTWYENKGKEGFGLGGYSAVEHDEDRGPRLLLNDQVQSVFLADLNGDGLTDLVRIRNGEVCYWPNKGFGRFGAKVTMGNAPFFDHPDTFNPQYIYISDITGTGAADILYLAQGKCSAYINRSGNSFSDSVDIATLPGIDPYSKVAVLDFLGNGTGCIVWSSPLPQYADAPLRYIDLMGGKKPHLMQTYSNGLGKTVSLSYKSSTQYYLADRRAGSSWATKLPFPVHCIDEILSSDLVSATSYKQSFSYHHGYYDHAEREFRGFGRVDTIDTDTAVIDPLNSNQATLDQDPVLTKSWYHTGAWMTYELLTDAFAREYFSPQDWEEHAPLIRMPEGLGAKEQREAYRALKGLPLRQEVYALDGSDSENLPYAVTAFGYCVRRLQGLPGPETGAGTWPNAVFYTWQEEKLGYSSERVTADPRLAQELVLETDEYGNILQSAQIAYPRRDIPASLPAAVQSAQGKLHVSYSRNTYTNGITADDLHYRLPLPATATACELYIPYSAYPGGTYNSDTLLGIIDPLSVLDFTTAMSGSSPLLRLISSSRSLYRDNDAATPLPLGDTGSLGIPHEQYALAFPTSLLTDPLYTDAMAGGRYVDLDTDGNYWLPSGQAVYGIYPQDEFYSVNTYLNPWNNTTDIRYWTSSAGEAYWLLPLSSTDAVNNLVTVNRYNWYSLQPELITDPNDNRSEMAYDALGLPVAMAVMGKAPPAVQEGDKLSGLNIEDHAAQDLFWEDPYAHAATLLGNASMRCLYRFPPLPGGIGGGSPQPVCVAMIGREQHYEPGHGSSATQIRITYTDGFGRIAMHKVQTADDPLSGDPRWIGSGKTVYNNKGKEVMQYEPYFSSTHTFDTTEQSANLGVSPRLHYDALGRLRRSELPDGTYNYTLWDGWMQVLYDANDCCLDSDWYDTWNSGTAEQQDAAAKAAAHAGTPTITHLDTLARPFHTIQLLEAMDISALPGEALTYDLTGIAHIASYETLDIQGNRLAVTDGRGNNALTYTYNMLQAVLGQTSIDSGTQYGILDVAGSPVFSIDPDLRVFRTEYDDLHRPSRQSVFIGGVQKVIGQMAYAEGLPNDRLYNLRGQLYRNYDNAGMSQVNAYDFKGNPISLSQQLLSDHTLVDVDWNASPVLAAEVFGSSTTYDALNRPMTQTDPGGNLQEFAYSKSGLLISVTMGPTMYFDDQRYNARGQRTEVWFGNPTKTSYTYDPATFRLTRLLTTRGGNICQDLRYWYDAVGNITQVQDHALQTLYYANAQVSPTQEFTYDSLYRLLQAAGREQIGTGSFGPSDNTDDASWRVALGSDAAQTYTQYYTYDETGNMLSLQHSAGSGSYTRDYLYSGGSNRLNGTKVGVTSYPYTYDNRGNMLTMPHLSAMAWNAQNELYRATQGTSTTYFNYSGGQRIRKVCEKAGGIQEQRIYLGNYEIYRKFVSGSLTVQRNTVHISDGTARIAMQETRTLGSDPAPANLQRYIYSNHLGSASLELDDTGAIISYEEYHPFGTTAYQASNATMNALAKRYRYTGKERDEETGLYYHGARYYIPWLARWSASDPMEAKYAGMSPYNYSMNNPIMMNDPSGASPDETVINSANAAQASTTSTPTHIGEGGIMESNTFAVERSAPPGSDPNTMAPIKGSVHDGMYAINDVNSVTGKSQQYWISAQQQGDFNIQFSYYDNHNWVPYWNNKQVHQTTMKAANDATTAIAIGSLAPLAILAAPAIPVIAGAISNAPAAILASFLNNPVSWTATTGAVLEGIAGYDGPPTSPVVAAEKAVVNVSEEAIEQTVKHADEVVDIAKSGLRLTEESVRTKLDKYLLNMDHPVGGAKAKWFSQALGFTQENAALLAKQIVFNSEKAVQTAVTEFGVKYNQTIPILGANGKTIDVLFSWIKNKDNVVRLVTAIPSKR